MLVEDNDIDCGDNLEEPAQHIIKSIYEAKGEQQRGEHQGDARIVDLGIELLGIVQGKPLPVGTLYFIPPEDQSETRHGKERSRHSAVEFIGRYLAHDLDDVLNRCVLHVQFVGVYILEGYLVEDGRIDAKEEREDSIGREEIDEHLQGVIVSDALAQHIVARHVSGTDNQVATRAHEPVVAPHEGANHIYQHLAQPQTLGFGLLAAVRAKISLERVAAIKTTIRLFRFRFFHIVYLTMGAEASACSSYVVFSERKVTKKKANGKIIRTN